MPHTPFDNLRITAAPPHKPRLDPRLVHAKQQARLASAGTSQTGVILNR